MVTVLCSFMNSATRAVNNGPKTTHCLTVHASSIRHHQLIILKMPPYSNNDFNYYTYIIFWTLRFHKQHISSVVGFLMITLLQIYCWTWRWKNFEYQSTFSKVMGKLQCPFFDSHGTYGKLEVAIEPNVYEETAITGNRQIVRWPILTNIENEWKDIHRRWNT